MAENMDKNMEELKDDELEDIAGGKFATELDGFYAACACKKTLSVSDPNLFINADQIYGKMRDDENNKYTYKDYQKAVKEKPAMNFPNTKGILRKLNRRSRQLLRLTMA